MTPAERSEILMQGQAVPGTANDKLKPIYSNKNFLDRMIFVAFIRGDYCGIFQLRPCNIFNKHAIKLTTENKVAVDERIAFR